MRCLLRWTTVAVPLLLLAGCLAPSGEALIPNTELFPDDRPWIASFWTETHTAVELTQSICLTVTVDRAVDTDLVVPFTVDGTAEAGVDHALEPGSVTIQAGSTEATLCFDILDDELTEPDETISVTLAAPAGAELGDIPTHTVIIEANVAELRHIILMIGDGMGFEQVRAAGLFASGTEGSLTMESLPHKAMATTHSADSAVTDSAAAATAMATGSKVNNQVISVALPGDGSDIETLLEIHKNEGKRTGLVTTAYVTHATPAAFGAHTEARTNYGSIAADYLSSSVPNVVFGGIRGDGTGMTATAADAEGYSVVTDLASLMALEADSVTHVSGQFGSGNMPYEYDGLGELPHLSQMTAVALDILEEDPDGFFIMVEGGRIDHAGHGNDIERCVMETIEFDNTVTVVMDWVGERDTALVIVTADHETGGLEVVSGNGASVMPDVAWSTTGHTEADVPVYAWGNGAEPVTGVIDNTALFDILTGE